jgi:c-di-GMP-binding flagellar brake protein YcgR
MSGDRRQYERIETDASVQIVDGDQILPALALNISLLGMQLLCDTATADRLGRHLGEGGEDIRVRVPDKTGGIDALCRVVYLRHGVEDEYRLGLEYTAFLDGSYDRLEKFVDDGSANDRLISRSR